MAFNINSKSSLLSAKTTTSSAKSKIEILVVFPHVTPFLIFSTAFRISLTNKLNNKGLRIQPWRTPTNISNQSVRLSPNNTLLSTFLYIFRKTLHILPLIPYFHNLYHKPSLHTLSYALATSIKAQY